jgi:hypothetical protein
MERDSRRQQGLSDTTFGVGDRVFLRQGYATTSSAAQLAPDFFVETRKSLLDFGLGIRYSGDLTLLDWLIVCKLCRQPAPPPFLPGDFP